MEYQETVVSLIPGLAVTGVCLVLFLIFLFLYYAFKSQRMRRIMSVMSAAFVLLTITMFCVTIIWTNVQNNGAGIEALKNNIMKKYDVERVLAFEPGHRISVMKEEQPVVVVVKGNEYLYTLHQNPETNEPTLSAAEQEDPKIEAPQAEGLVK